MDKELNTGFIDASETDDNVPAGYEYTLKAIDNPRLIEVLQSKLPQTEVLAAEGPITTDETGATWSVGSRKANTNLSTEEHPNNALPALINEMVCYIQAGGIPERIYVYQFRAHRHAEQSNWMLVCRWAEKPDAA